MHFPGGSTFSISRTIEALNVSGGFPVTLTHLSDKQLKNLFMLMNQRQVSPRGRAILLELMRRGVFFDAEQGDFLTRFEWKLRYQGDEPPSSADYIVYLRMHAKQANGGAG
jgi:hypothetical protein